jgi:hypothetical protein
MTASRTSENTYKEIVRVRLDRYPELTAVRLFDELKAAGPTEQRRRAR